MRQPLRPYLLIASAAVEGLLAGCGANVEQSEVVVDVTPSATPSDESATAHPAEPRHTSTLAIAKECCRGRNECKGLGNCKVAGKHDCKGKNACKGMGGCSPPDCAHPGPAPKACCAGKNECKGRGNCKVMGDHACKGQNQCKGKGGCKPSSC